MKQRDVDPFSKIHFNPIFKTIHFQFAFNLSPFQTFLHLLVPLNLGIFSRLRSTFQRQTFHETVQVSTICPRHKNDQVTETPIINPNIAHFLRKELVSDFLLTVTIKWKNRWIDGFKERNERG